MQITTYSEANQDVETQLMDFRNGLEEATVAMKKEQHRKEVLLEAVSSRYAKCAVLKKVWKVFRENQAERKYQRELENQMDDIYRRNLLKKAFFPWRTLTYKDGYANTVRVATHRDIASIHTQYSAIVDILKSKIAEVDEVTRLKRAAKGEFAFALSKNLLKSISNLSLEVMSLNQMALRGGECDEGDTKKFMKDVGNVIRDKLNKVRDYKRTLLGQAEGAEGEEKAKRKKKITFL